MAVLVLTATLLLAVVGGYPLYACTLGDVFCGPGCETVVLCVDDNQQYPLTNCSLFPNGTVGAGRLCDSATLTCRPASQVSVCKSPADETLFRCHANGYFPNPYDCHSYFNCTGSTPYPAQGTLVNCSGGLAYDPLTQDCRLTSSDSVCTKGPVAECLSAGQNGAVEGNANLYYVCVNDPASNTLVPWLFQCPNITELFVNGRCQERDALSTTSAASATTSSQTPTTSAVSTTTSSQTPTTSTTSTTTSSQTPTTSAVSTTTSSQTPTTSAVSTTTSSQTPTTSTASTTTSSQTPTTSAVSTTTGSQTPTTTTASTTTSSQTPTTTTAPASTTAPYYCVQPGTKIADPVDCHSFYLCTQDLVQIQYKCRDGYYYNTAAGGYCVKGSC